MNEPLTDDYLALCQRYMGLYCRLEIHHGSKLLEEIHRLRRLEAVRTELKEMLERRGKDDNSYTDADDCQASGG